MCRLVLSFATRRCGCVEAAAVVAAASRLSQGTRGTHEKPDMRHIDGWGASWIERSPKHRRRTVRSVHPIATDVAARDIEALETPFLAVHVRDATERTKQGPEFTHPIDHERLSVMHNGYLPQVADVLPVPGDFDTAAYLEFVATGTDRSMSAEALAQRVAELPPGGTSANAIFLDERARAIRAFVVHWFPPDSDSPRFYTMWWATTIDSIHVASEPCEELAPIEMWSRLPKQAVLQFELGRDERDWSLTTCGEFK